MPPRFRAAVFDLDGTLIDTEPAHLDAQSRALQELGVDPLDPLRPRTFGMGIERGVRTLANAFGLNRDLLRRTYIRAWESNLQNGVTFMPGAASLLAWLRARSVPMALVTSGDRKYAGLIDTALNLTQFFPVIVTADDVEHTKPHPEPYLRGVEEFRLPSTEVIGFEDSGPGLSALLAAGIYAVAVHRQIGERPELRGADHALSGLETLDPAVLSGWFQNARTERR